MTDSWHMASPSAVNAVLPGSPFRNEGLVLQFLGDLMAGSPQLSLLGTASTAEIHCAQHHTLGLAFSITTDRHDQVQLILPKKIKLHVRLTEALWRLHYTLTSPSAQFCSPLLHMLIPGALYSTPPSFCSSSQRLFS